jgi:hypothetical protein
MPPDLPNGTLGLLGSCLLVGSSIYILLDLLGKEDAKCLQILM